MAFDSKCLDLANEFLPAGVSDGLAARLAQHIQDEIENWLLSERDRLNADLKGAGHADLV